MKKYIVLLAGIVLQICLGGVYAWSKFVPELQESFGYTSVQTQSVFATAIAVFTFGMLITGRLHDRYGPRPLAVAAGLALGCGYFFAGSFGGSFPALWFFYGGICGAASAFGYVCPIATGIKWFPSRPSFISGLMVAGYGGGAVFLSSLVNAMLNRGMPVLRVMQVVGLLYGTICIIAGLLLILPDHEKTAPVQVFDRRRLWRDVRFYPLLAGMFCGTFPGLMLIGDLEPIGLRMKMPPVIAATGIITLALGNAAGRIIWGLFQDRHGNRLTSCAILCAAALTPLLLLAAPSSSTLFLLSAGLLGFAYGGSFGVYPAQVSRIYGNSVLGTIYPIVLASHGIAVLIAAPIGGRLLDLTESDTSGLILAAAVAGTGLLLYVFLEKNSKRTPSA